MSEWLATCPSHFTSGEWSPTPTEEKAGGPQRWFGGFGEKKNLLPPSGLESILTYIFYARTHTCAYA